MNTSPPTSLLRYKLAPWFWLPVWVLVGLAFRDGELRWKVGKHPSSRIQVVVTSHDDPAWFFLLAALWLAAGIALAYASWRLSRAAAPFS